MGWRFGFLGMAAVMLSPGRGAGRESMVMPPVESWEPVAPGLLVQRVSAPKACRPTGRDCFYFLPFVFGFAFTLAAAVASRRIFSASTL